MDETRPVMPGKEERNWAMGCHLAALAGYLVSFSLAQVFAPLVVWLLKRNDGGFIDQQGKEALNFQLSILVYALICFLLFFAVVGFVLIFPLMIFGFICPIIGAIKASDGVEFRYPLCIRFIK
ncbi:DUF4870 domain-containing protein [Pontiella sp.]|uniref:DUF4870 domain-containing protein n=1 Tax=Pontiella sp. TaxID=2837462 RepID=UPI003561B3FD